ncbi:visual pigment-like receptor peropsin [Lycorma delicatula]|uniref:visual pigment-like receptor peropsin n=1 Tax=Lycorma delicatula TaxID=130591 RepID=UPI003F51858A
MWLSGLTSECLHEGVLNQEMKMLLGILLVFSGLLSSAVNIWLVSSLFLRAEMISYIHLRLLNLSVACFGRTLLAGYPFQAPSAIAGRWLFGDACCKLFAFLHQFFSVAEIMSLMFLARECLCLIQPSYIGNTKNYIGSTLAVWLMSLFWAILPFFNFGRYSCDVAGISCDLDWSSRTKSEFSYNMSYLLFAVVLPLFLAFLSLFQAISSSTLNFHFSGLEKYNSIKAVLAVIVIMLLMWTPGGILCTFRFLGVHVTDTIVFITMISTEMSGLFPTLSFFCFDNRTRCALLGRQYEENNFRVKSIVKNRRYEGQF